MTVKGRTILSAVLAACLVLTGLAAWSAVGVTWQGQKKILPTPMHWSGVCAYQGKIYLFGGNLNDAAGNTTMSDAVQIYDVASDTWTAGTPMPTKRYLCTAVEVGGKIYVMGGRNFNVPGAGPLDKNEVYDPATNTWTTAKATPVPIRGQAATAYNGKIYMIGGNADPYSNAVNIYDPASDSWSTGAAMPKYLAYGAAVTHGDKIYYIGGDYATVESPTDIFGGLLIYDPVANTWDTTIYPMAEAVEVYGQSTVDPTTGKIYLFGGLYWSDDQGGEEASTSIQAFNTATKTWAFVDAVFPSPLGRGYTESALVNGKIYVMAGSRGPWVQNVELPIVEEFNPADSTFYQPNAVVPDYGFFGGVAGAIGGKIYSARGASSGVDGIIDAYDIAGNTWTKKAANPTPQYYATGGVDSGKLIVSGGVTGSQSPTGNTAAYDPATDTWSSLAANPTKAYLSAGAITGGKLYVFGGDTSWSTSKPTSDLQVLDLAANTWAKKASLPSVLKGAVAAAYEGKIYVIGGLKGTDITKKASWNYGLLVYDPATDTYDTSKAALPFPQAYAACDIYGGYIFVYGGYTFKKSDGTEYWNYMQDIQVYDIAANAWSTLEGQFCRLWCSMVASGGKLYIFDGLDPDFTADRLCIGVISGVGPMPLSATASANPTTGAAPLNVQFTGGASGGTSPYTYSWAFGDGGTSTSQSPTHTYAADGSYTATLTVTDSASGTATASAYITVGGGTPLSATATATPMTGQPPLAVNFTVTASGGAPPYTYAWDFGDGATSTDQNPSHTYEADGIYSATVKVTDSDSASVNKILLITVVSAQPPVISLMKKTGNPFGISVTGSNLQNGVKVYINGSQWTNVKWKSTTSIKIKGGGSLKAVVPKNTPTTFRFVNPDSGEVTLTWQWP